MSVQIENLLRPRYKIIAPIPFKEEEDFWKVGEILDRDWGWHGDDEDGFKYHISDYPHLFKKLEWWEERAIEEMPECIIFSKDYCNFKKGQVFKTENWNKQHDAAGFCIGFITGPGKYDKCAVPASCGIQPATLAEYEQYINQKGKQ